MSNSKFWLQEVIHAKKYQVCAAHWNDSSSQFLMLEH